jgi:hypothetical protein
MTALPPTALSPLAIGNDRLTSIVLKNPGNRRSSKNGVVITLALFGVERAIGDAARLACRTTVRRAVPPAKNSESASAASAIVIGPKIGFFQHNTSTPVGRNAQIRVIPRSFRERVETTQTRRSSIASVGLPSARIAPQQNNHAGSGRFLCYAA